MWVNYESGESWIRSACHKKQNKKKNTHTLFVCILTVWIDTQCNNANAVRVRRRWKSGWSCGKVFFVFFEFICFPACSHQLLSLDSPGCVLQDRVHHLWRVQLPKLPENKDNKATSSLTSAKGGPRTSRCRPINHWRQLSSHLECQVCWY